MTGDRILYQGRATDTVSTWELSLSVGFTLMFAAFVVIAFTDPRLGSPLYYIPLLAISAGAALWIIRGMTAVLRVVSNGDGDRIIQVKGPRHNIVMRYDSGLEFWYSHERTKIRQGGYTMVRYNLVVPGPDGRSLGFRMDAGRGGGEPESWLMRDDPLRNGRDIFNVSNLIALMRALEPAGPSSLDAPRAV